MPLTPGDQLGPYAISALIGRGGMGEVYKARDTRLNRDVAIKTSAEKFSDRFEREAQAIAALNHPNICTLFDVGPNYLVMEYIEGDSPKGPLPLETVLDYARQMADALDAAHEKGITHRDLKPGNLKITPDGKLKVLDFGLAKVAPTSRADYSSENSPTLTMGMTEVGMILGTAAYMAPEQAKGKPVDKRADIWAYGVVLYELATGKRLFKGEDVSDILASVLKDEPHYDAVPAPLRPLLRKCLEKDPKKRLRDIADASSLLTNTPAPTEPVRARTWWIPWAAAAVFALSTAALGWLWTRPEPPPAVTRFQIFAPPGSTLPLQTPAPSPDGRMLAYTIADAAGVRRLYLRKLDSTQSTLLPGTEGAVHPFWSPDGKSLAFVADNILKRIDMDGGSPRTLATQVAGPWHGAWNENGDILAALVGGGLWRLSARNGGTPVQLTKPGTGHPSFLPNGHRFLFRTDSDTRLGSLDSQDSQILLKGVSGAPLLATTPEGKTYLFYLQESDLTVQEFDPNTEAVRGEPMVLIPNIGRVANPLVKPALGVSQTGVLAYQTGSGGTPGEVTWFDHDGKNLGKISSLNPVRLRFSPDGNLLGSIQDGDIWVTDLTRGTSSRLTRDGQNIGLAWSPDGRRLATLRSGSPTNKIVAVSLDGSGEQVLLDRPGQPTSWDTGHLAFNGEGGQLFVTSVDGKQAPLPVSLPNSQSGQLSPDGAYVAYDSNSNGRREVFLEPLPPQKGRVQVSNGYGRDATWSRDGRQLFFADSDGNLMSVDVRVGASVSVGIPRKLFRLNGVLVRWDVHPDGKRFAAAVISEDQADNPITVVLNWFADLRK